MPLPFFFMPFTLLFFSIFAGVEAAAAMPLFAAVLLPLPRHAAPMPFILLTLCCCRCCLSVVTPCCHAMMMLPPMLLRHARFAACR